MAAAALNPMILNTIQQDVVSHFSSAYSQIGGYASDLFYLLAVIELALFGLVWALRQEASWGLFFFKIIKLGAIFLIIRSYPYILQTLINGFTDTAFHGSGSSASGVFFNPGKIWKYGFDASLSMLKLSVQYGTPNISLGMLYLFLGFGSLLLFALIGAEIIVITAAFYVVSLVALLLIPFGTLTVTKNFLEQAISGVMQMGARMFGLIMVLGVGVSAWGSLGASIDQNTKIDTLLGFFFATLVIFVLAIKVPKLAATAVGHIGGSFFDGMSAVSSGDASSAAASVNISGANSPNASSIANTGAGANAGAVVSNPAAAIQAATNVSAVVGGGAGGGASSGSTVSVAGSSSSAGMLGGAGDGGKVGKGADVSRGLSPETVNKLKTSFKQILRDHDKQK